jgi:FMN phosphatase YigB (HAD superfamily)
MHFLEGNFVEPMLKKSDLIIFDLDGTLYEDTDHFDYYASLLQKRLPAGQQGAFSEEYRKMKDGSHIVAIGKAYDVNRDCAITVDAMTDKATAVHDWEGREWDQSEVKRNYGDRLHFDFENMIAIGDGWWLPFVTSRHFGLTSQETYICYNTTKEYMVTDDFQLTKTPGLKEGLHSLKQTKPLVLMTNSEKDDVERLLKELDLEWIFDRIVPSALKPSSTKKHLQALMAYYQVPPEKTLSIGDNFINEIAPALLLGMNALYIQPHLESGDHDNLVVVKSMADVFHD